MPYEAPFNPALDEAQATTDQSPTWGDYGKAVKTGALGVASSAASLGSYAADEAGYTDAAQLAALNAHSIRGEAQDTQASISQGGQQALTTWQHPLSSIGMRGAEMAPGMAAAMVPSFLLGPEAGMATMAGMSMGQLADDIAGHVDQMTPDQLPAAYQEMLKTMPEQEVRDLYRDSLANGDGRMALAALAGAAGGASIAGKFGVTGKLAQVGVSAAEQGAMGAGMDIAEQGAGVAGGWQDGYSPEQTAEEALGGAAVGGAFGAAHAVMSGGKFEQTGSSRRYAKTPAADDDAASGSTATTTVEKVGDLDPNAAQTQALNNKPVEKPQSKPTQSPAPDATGEVTDQSNPPVAQGATDTAQAETPDTLKVQQQELVDGKRQLMVFKGGENLLDVPDGFKQTKIKGDVYQYDPEQMTPKQIRQAIKDDTLGELLRLGTITKNDAIQSAEQGATPVGVVERQPDGTEVRAAAGTDETAPTQTAEFQQTAAPGNSVQVEAPEQVIQARVEGQPETAPAAEHQPAPPAPAPAPEPPMEAPAPQVSPEPPQAQQPRVLRDVSAEGQAQDKSNLKGWEKKLAKNMSVGEEAAPAAAGHRTKAEVAARQDVNQRSQEIVEQHGQVPTSRLEAVNHARAVTEASKDVTIPNRFNTAANAEHNFGPHAIAVREARRVASSSSPPSAAIERYRDTVQRALIGDREGIVEQRRQEGAERMQRGGKSAEDLTKEQTENEQERHVSAAERNVRHDEHNTEDEISGGIADTYTHEVSPEDEAAEEGERLAAERNTLPEKKVEAVAGRKPEEVAQGRDGEMVAKAADMLGVKVEKVRRRIPVDRRAAGLNGVPTGTEGVYLTPIGTTDLAGVIKRAALGKLPGAGEKISDAVAQRISEIAGDVPVHVVPHDQLTAVFGNEALGMYSGKHNYIAISDEAVDSPHLAHTVLHEAVHAAVKHAMDQDSYAKQNMYALMREFWHALPDEQRFADKEKGQKQYGFTNVDEFVAEMLSNRDMRDLAMATPMSRQLAARLGIADWRKGTEYKGVLPALWHGFVTAIQRALGIAPKDASFLEGVLSEFEKNTHALDPKAGSEFNERIDSAQTLPMLKPDDVQHEAEDPRSSLADRSKLLSSVSDQIAGVKSWKDELSANNAFKFLSNDQLRQSKENLFGEKTEKNMVRRLAEGIEKAGVRMRKLLQPADKLGEAMNRARVAYPEQWDKFTQLMNESTMHNVHPDVGLDDDLNRHLALPKSAKNDESEGAMRNWQARAKHDDLSRDYRSLPEELQGLYQQARDYYAGERDARVKQHIEAVLEGVSEPEGVTRDEARDQIFKGDVDDDVAEHYEGKGLGKTLLAGEELQRTQGPYFPLKRVGKYVASGKRELSTPAGATRVTGKDNAFDFATREAAQRYAKGLDDKAGVRKVYHDPDTGEAWSADEAKAQGEKGKYRVTVENNHVSFHESERDARAMTEALKKDGFTMNAVDERRQGQGVDYGLRSGQVDALVKAVERRKDLSDNAKAVLAKSLEESSVALQRGNRIESTYLKRKNVGGASTDAIRTLSDYSHASAAYRARAEFKSDIDGALKEMRDHTDKNRQDEKTLDRRRVVGEFERRLEGFGSPEYMGKMGPVWQKVMLLSFLKRMASPAHLALHMMHPVMTSMPVIAGERGMGRTYREFARAYKEMGGLGALGEGGKGLVRQARDNGAGTNFGAYFRSRLKGEDAGAIRDMFRELETTGHLHPDAGFDVARYSEANSKLDRGLGRVDRAFRELTGSTESVNRYVTATAAYRLAVKDGMTPEQATRYAKDSIANTQGLYSATNAAPVFRNPRLKPFMQFKQYPAMIIHLMGKLVHDAFKGETPEARQQALRSFAGMMGTAALLTGVNGLPTEAVKAVTLLGNALGVTPSWDTLDSEMRVGLAHELGPQLANLVMNGITSQGPLAVDAHHRLGYSSMLSFGDPKSDKPDDIKSWLFDTLGGAPVSLGMDTMAGVKAALHGDLEGAFEKLTPIKAIDDLAKAGRYTLEGKPTPSGKPGMPPLDAPAAVMQALGFTPRSVADYGEARYQAGQTLAQERQDKPNKKVGPKGAAILGISRNRKNTATLNDFAGSYGAQ